MKKSFIIPLSVFAILVVGILFFALNTSGSSSAQSPINGIGGGDTRTDLKPARASQELAKTYQFPLKDANGKEVSKLKYVIENAELRDEILIKGKRATSVKGKTILVVNIKITNDFNKPVQISAADYIRLIIDGQAEKIAPDIHNDPVSIQAISTKTTRVGFPIDETQKNLTLQVGEITGKKETIQLNLR